ncbi:methyltransferase family protein [Candidatus Leptofilum sp.]|uniref:methyltransferase family protein n=1 Tax=Candidatus Leptofilum sp. TaxID=3241576 RepID=UPI003B5C7318
MKFFLLIYLILFYGVAFFWRSYVTWQATGINPYRLSNKDDIPSFLGRVYRLVFIGNITIVLLYILGPAHWYSYLGPLDWLEESVGTAVGILLLILAFPWVLISQAQMGSSWRIGIDEQNQTALVTQGIFRFSRNPIFLGVRLNLLGWFLIMPNAFTLALWLLGDVSIQIQIFLEENHLHQQHGIVYEQYMSITPRYLGIPGVLNNK